MNETNTHSGDSAVSKARELTPDEKEMLDLIKAIKSLAIRLKDKSDEVEKSWKFEV